MNLMFLSLRCYLFAAASIFAFAAASAAYSADRPNILWITSEDNGPQLGCYGDPYAVTPNIDALAQKSLRYRRCWSNAPVCAPARTTIISGMYATSLGGHHMRSGITLPPGMKLYPEVLREAGYYCTNNSKTDYNFAAATGGWNENGRTAHWRGRPDSETPFFAVFNYTVSHESKIRTRPHKLIHDPSSAPLPAYHPDTPEVRHDWAQYYDKMTEMDQSVGGILKELDEDGLAESTIVFYYGDHGSGMPRSKRWPFDSGLRVPLLLHVPERFKSLAPDDYVAGSESARLTAFVDLGPTAISLAGVKPPSNMQGIPFAGKYEGKPKKYLFGYRGRMDERIDMVRSCTDGRYVYMRHFYPDRPYLKHVDYMFQTPTTRVWKEMFDAGKLNEAQAKFWRPKPVEELFDLASDPDEVNNVAGNPEHAERVAKMRQVLKDWMIETADMGIFTEAEMHQRCVNLSPREYGLSDAMRADERVSLAFDAMSDEGIALSDSLDLIRQSEDSGMDYWVARGLAIHADGVPQRAEYRRALLELAHGESPSVAIAACDGLLAAGNKKQVREAIERLIELANVEKVGHFAAVAALNVLDMNAELTDRDRAAIAALPRQVAQPPVRVGKYVGKLIDHLP
jgi:arylsulfatase A-like enzyme